MLTITKHRGYITVEATMIFPIVFFVTLLVLGMVFMIHDQVIVRTKTDTVLMRSSLHYSKKYSIVGEDRDGKFGDISKNKDLNIYWRFEKNNKFEKDGESILNSHISKSDVFKETNEFQAKNKIGFFTFYNDIDVQRSNFLVNGVSRVLSLKKDGNHVYKNTMPIFDQGEFIRNVDLIKDVGIVFKGKVQRSLSEKKQE